MVLGLLVLGGLVGYVVVVYDGFVVEFDCVVV